MSSRSQPLPPLYSSQPQPAQSAQSAHPTLTAPAAPAVSTPMAATQTTPAPFALPAPPFHAPQHRGISSRLPPPLQLGPVPPHSGSILQRHSPSLGFNPQERWAGTSGDQPGTTGQSYTPPISDPSYSHYYGQTSHEPVEFGRPPPPTWEQRTWPADPRSEFSTYPSPAYPDPRGIESAYGSAATQVGLEVQPRREASILAGEPRTTSGLNQYEIRVRQQPIAARACGFGERDRRVIDPPPIVQLTFRGPAPPGADPAEIEYPFNVVHCTLWNEEGSVDETAIPGQDRRMTRRLMGTLVASPFVGTDENDQRGCFFCFPDLSCRTHGRYRLRFVLMRIEMSHARPGGYMPVLTSTLSDVFTVYTAKNFPGMRASTALTKALKRQGCAISVKKGNEKVNRHAREDESEEEEGDESQTIDRGKKRRKG